MMNSESAEKGRRVLQQLHGGKTGDKFFDKVETVCPDWAKMTRNHLFGEVWSRPALGLRDRCMITIAICVSAHGYHDLGLKAQIEFALNLGLTWDEIFEIIIHASHYGGWPCGANAMRRIMKIFYELEGSKDEDTNK